MAKQGSADGLCGLYALINFLVLKDEVASDGERTEHETGFFLLCEAAERAGLLTAHRLAYGFTWPDLVEIFNLCAERWCIGYRATPLLELKGHFGRSFTHSRVLSELIDKNGGAVVAVNSGKHWVLVADNDTNGGFTVMDSSSAHPKESLRRTADLAEGLAILPTGSQLLKAADA